MSARAEYLESQDATAPFDWAMEFTLRHVSAFLKLALVPALIKTGLSYIEYFHPLSARQHLLIFGVGTATKIWMLVVTMLFIIGVLQGTRQSLLSLSQHALLMMPKVFLSSIALALVAMAFYLAPWMYLFVIFIVWAPVFCAAEILAKSYRSEEADEAEEEDEEGGRIFRLRKFRFFADKPIWDLGFSRSIQFTSQRQNLIATVQLSLLMLIDLTLPVALIVALAGFDHGFSWIIVEAFFSSFLHALVLAMICATFLRVLPKAGVEELNIARSAAEQPEKKRLFRFKGRILPFAFLALCGGLATRATFEYISVNNSKPDNLQFEIEKFDRTKLQFVVTMSMDDQKNKFRWMDPLRFELQLIPDEAPKAEPSAAEIRAAEEAQTAQADATASPVLAPVATPTPDPKALGFLPLERAMLYGIDGSLLPEDNFAPFEGAIRVVLNYTNTLTEEQRSGKFVLYYSPSLGEREKLGEGRFE